MRSRINRRLAAATALLSLLAVSAATGGVWLRCRITGVIQPACCCPMADAAETPAPRPATVEAGDCCDRIVADVVQAPSEAASRAPVATPPVAIAPAESGGGLLSTAPFGDRFAREASRAGPPTTRARLLSKSAFLI